MEKITDNIVCLDALELSQTIRRRELSCREVMKAYLSHIGQVNPQVNAIVSLQEEDDLLRQADARDEELRQGICQGVLHGVPQAVKDLALTKGIRTTMASPIFKDYVPTEDAIIVERVKASGAIIIGKTNTPEFGLGSQTFNNVFGVTRNAYDQRMAAGGSSGGAAVALALRMLPVADGSDMMGSLRNPAAFNNVYGFRPSLGRVPRGPAGEVFYQQFSVEGPMGRTVQDLALLLSIQAGYDERDPISLQNDPDVFTLPLEHDMRGRTIGWLGDLGGYLPMEDGILELGRQALNKCEDIGCHVDECKLGFAPERLWDTWLTMRAFLVAGKQRPLYQDPDKRAMMKPEAVWEVERGMQLSAADVYGAAEVRTAWYKAVCELFRRYDYLAMPAAQVFPFPAEIHWPRSIGNCTMDTYHRWMECVIPASLVGVPAISMPAGFGSQGLPTGIQIIGRPQGDLDVLRLARAYEQATGWVQTYIPPLLGEKNKKEI